MDVMMLKVHEAAAQLGVSRAKMYELIASGAIDTVMLGRCRRIRVEDLRRFVAGLEVD